MWEPRSNERGNGVTIHEIWSKVAGKVPPIRAPQTETALGPWHHTSAARCTDTSCLLFLCDAQAVSSSFVTITLLPSCSSFLSHFCTLLFYLLLVAFCFTSESFPFRQVVSVGNASEFIWKRSGSIFTWEGTIAHTFSRQLHNAAARVQAWGKSYGIICSLVFRL
jgi:hypothetical protein